MTKNHTPKNHPKIQYKTGVILINLGTPDGYDYFSVRKYLKEFLSDRRVIEVNPILWKIILNLFILTFRPSKTGATYKKIWDHKKNMSPLKIHSINQAKKLSKLVSNNHKNFIVDYAMRYGKPSIEEKIKLLQSKGCKKFIFIPLYPQYAAATTATVCDEIFRVMKKLRWQPNFRIADQYCDNPSYINALANTIEASLKSKKVEVDAILSSYHGIPKEYFSKGDPYQCFCHKTHRLLSDELIKRKIKIPHHICFQSRFGPKEWLQPYAEDKIIELAKSGVKNLMVITPGFAADCIETLEEIDMEYHELFLANNGKKFHYVSCLNDNDDSIELYYDLVKKNLWAN